MKLDFDRLSTNHSLTPTDSLVLQIPSGYFRIGAAREDGKSVWKSALAKG